MKRRAMLAGFGTAMTVGPCTVAAQQQDRVWRIGWLANTPLTIRDSQNYWEAFRVELQRLGWIERKNVIFELRFASGVAERYPALARELIESGVDVIVAASGDSASLAARDSTKTIPVVFITSPDPLGAGLVATLARPGGNLTGIASMSRDLIGKRMEMLKDAFPSATRIGYLTSFARTPFYDDAARAAAALGLQLVPVTLAAADSLAGAISGQSNIDAWFVAETTLFLARREEITSAFAALRRPVMYSNSVFVRAGGLISYGADFFDQSRRGAHFVDRILRGARPADIPVEQPVKLELAVNLRTARAQGLTIPPSVLARADEVVE